MMKGETIDLHAVTESGRSSGVEHGDVLVAFAEAVVDGDAGAITLTRRRVIDAMGVEAMVDAAAVVSNFERMVRIADGTGIPLGDRLEAIGRPALDELGLDRLRAGGHIS
jgi:hypothetical protein